MNEAWASQRLMSPGRVAGIGETITLYLCRFMEWVAPSTSMAMSDTVEQTVSKNLR